eukprot:CAMPEP_0206516646 /NCGR_PEP_ID=MMETSP0324_2-20121206/63487_1 /ASSEMBLY_ACC=CAM_ASM_000836 /TAXON_ID=2866 /ORGANISM="Crypthecodinium cohnii, Strain Seligo" /LENGTH=38 /DNA_ID= /DNA_START= /DNA_END= /DNA_ORIENTATION=
MPPRKLEDEVSEEEAIARCNTCNAQGLRLSYSVRAVPY